jgi:uncharacterized protein YjbI with pentapeptide repeats
MRVQKFFHNLGQFLTCLFSFHFISGIMIAGFVSSIPAHGGGGGMEVDFSFMDLEGASFVDANLDGANFRYAFLRETQFWGATIIGNADFYSANLEGARFVKESCDEFSINETHPLIWNTDFTNADLTSAVLTGIQFEKVSFDFATLDKAELCGAKLPGAQFLNAGLREANLQGANLSDANLHHAKLMGANLQGAWLAGADLSYANLTGADLRGAILAGACFEQATLKNTLFSPGAKDRINKNNCTKSGRDGEMSANTNALGAPFYRPNPR